SSALWTRRTRELVTPSGSRHHRPISTISDTPTRWAVSCSSYPPATTARPGPIAGPGHRRIGPDRAASGSRDAAGPSPPVGWLLVDDDPERGGARGQCRLGRRDLAELSAA